MRPIHSSDSLLKRLLAAAISAALLLSSGTGYTGAVWAAGGNRSSKGSNVGADGGIKPVTLGDQIRDVTEVGETEKLAGDVAGTVDEGPVQSEEQTDLKDGLAEEVGNSVQPKGTLEAFASTAPKMADAGEQKRVYDKGGASKGEPSAAESAVSGRSGSNNSGLKTSDSSGFRRLFESVQPKNITSHLTLDPSKTTFQGHVVLTGKLKKKTDKITLHAVDMKFDVAQVKVNGVKVNVDKITTEPDPVHETVTLHLDHMVGAEDVEVELKYTGKFFGDLEGLYRIEDKHDGVTEYMIGSQFEAVTFRRAIPSLADEPEAKVTIDMTITAPADKKILFNTEEKQNGRTLSEDGKWRTVQFKQTPVTATYPVAISVGRLEAVTAYLPDGRRISVWAQPEKKRQLEFALDVAKRVIEFFEKKTGIKYPLEKLDLLLLPEFRSGAMENWGLITFRDSRLLIDPELSTVEDKKKVAMVVAHEIAHMWFGDLVTMEWWDGLYLNESNADLMGFLCASELFPEWNFMQDYLRETWTAYAVDGLKRGTHKIEMPVKLPGEIEAIFDQLTYEKGGSLLWMIRNYIGDDAYWKGIGAYLKAHAYGNAKTIDFWSSLEAATNGKAPVVKIAKDWYQQEGYPAVRAEVGGEGSLKLTQRRFYNSAGPADYKSGDPADQTLWTIPMIIRYSRGGKEFTKKVLLKERSADVTLDGEGKLDWAYINDRQTGYYRSEFDDRLFGKVAASLPHLLPVERMGLMNDLWTQAKAGGSMERFLSVVSSLKNDQNRFIIQDIGGYLTEISDRLIKTPSQQKAYRSFAARQFGLHWKRLGWPKKGDSDEIRLARAAVIQVLGPQRAEIIDISRKKLMGYFADSKSLDPLLLIPMLSVVTGQQKGAKAVFDRLTRALDNPETPGQKDAYLRSGFGGFKDKKLLNEVLEMSLSDKVKQQDAWILMGSLIRSPASQSVAWPWAKKNFQRIRKKVGARMAKAIVMATSGLDFPGAAKDIHEFFTDRKNKIDSAMFALPQAEEISSMRSEFAGRMRYGIGPILNHLSAAHPGR